MEYLTKPPTKKMLAHLKKARAIELSQRGRNICRLDDFNGTFPGLYNRGFIDTRKAILDNEEIFSAYITQRGINFLNQYQEDRKELGTAFNLNLIRNLFSQLAHTMKLW